MASVQYRNKKTGDISGELSGDLLAHYDVHARNLPWRTAPGSAARADPYHIWLSEIMLQQTTVAAAAGYFEKFMARWPNFAALAAAGDDDVMAAWAGLGYYARARNLITCARIVAASYGGALPVDESELLKLPGIGAYTAAAISAIAFGRRAVVVDANIERVAARLFAIGEAFPGAKRPIRQAVDAITPADRCGDFAQAMMDLGAGICRAKAPLCGSCPIARHCAAYDLGKAEAFPVKPAKKDRPVRNGTAYWIERDGHVLLVRRGGKGMLGGMRALPDDRWSARADGDATAPFDADWQILAVTVQHSFTHFTLDLRIAVTKGPPRPEYGDYWPIKTLDKAGLPTLFKKAASAAKLWRE